MKKLAVAVAACLAGLVGAAASGQVLYVDAAAASGGNGSSWGAAYNDLQAALSAARTNLAVTEVRVAQGVYKPGPAGSERGVSFALVERVALRGGYAGGSSATPDTRDLRGTPSILSGDLGGSDISGGGRGDRYENAYHVVTAVGLAYPAVIDGFHIVGGHADGNGLDGRGGGMLVDQCAGNLTVSRCTLRDNYGQFGGAAMVYDTAGVFSQCVVAGNRANLNPGVEVNGYRLGVTPLFVGCTIAMNTSAFPYGSAGLVSQASGANPGPGPAVIAVRAPVVSCVVFGNSSSAFVQYAPQFGGFYEATACVSSEADGWQGGVRQNVTGDPRFANAPGADGVVGTLDDDFRLLQGSPAINAGAGPAADPADVDTDGNLSEGAERDADGLARLHGASVDIGAFEGPVLAVVTSAAALSINEGSTLTYNVRLTRDPGADVVVSTFAEAVGGTGLVVTPPTVTLGSGNWSAGVDVTLSWPADAGLTDETTSLVFTGPGMAPSSQTVVQVDGTTPPSVLYVNASATLPADGTTWATGYRKIEDALAVTVAFPAIQQVWVAAGTYRPPLTPGENDQRLRKYVMRSGLKLVGGFAGTETSPSQRALSMNKTLITGDNQNNDGPGFTNYGDNCEVLVQVNGAVAGTSIDGFDFERSTEAAVSFNLSSPEIDVLSVYNCRFAFNRGSGLKRRAAQGVSEVRSCVFEDNGVLGENYPALNLVMYGNQNPVQRIDISGCVFRRNRGATGCALFFVGERLNLTDCEFSDNSGDGVGVRSMGACAAIEVYGRAANPVMATVQDCTFTGNTGTSYGGGLAIAYTGPTDPVRVVSRVRHCTFTGNASQNVGGLYLAAAGTESHEVSGCTFVDNSAVAIAGASTGGRYINCVFLDNSAQNAGAGPTDAEACLFENNTATGTGGAAGACQRLVRCTFRNNTAARAGAVEHSQMIDGCVFEDNHATAGDGGAVGGATRAINSLFARNTATGNGGVGRVIDSIGCRFSGNTAGGNGGALYDVLRTANCLFTGNMAGGTGGAVYSIWNVIGCTVYGNHAASVGGIDAVNLTTASASARHAANCVFWGNTAATGTVEQQQLRFGTTSDPYTEFFGGGRGGAVGVETFDFVCTAGPLVGGFTTPFPAALLSGGPVPPFTRAVVAAPPPGGLPGLTLPSGPPEQWVGLPADGTGAVPSMLLQTGTGNAPLVYSHVEWKVTMLADGQLGDAVNAGVFMGAVPMPLSTGGSPGVQTEWTFDASDAVEPGQRKWMSFYIRNDAGFGGACIRSNLKYIHPPVAWCIIQGLTVHEGNGNLGANPGLDLIAGPDEILGTLDDDATPSITSLAIDSGNSRMVAVDQYDYDGDGDITEVFMSDVDGRPRVADCVVDHGAVGVRGPIDRGAVEVSPFQALMAAPCAADIGSAGGVYGRDGLLDNNDFIAFIDAFFLFSAVADMGSAGGVAGADGLFDNNDFIVFIDVFFSGC